MVSQSIEWRTMPIRVPRRSLGVACPAFLGAAGNSRNAVELTRSKRNQSVDGRLVRVLAQSSFNPIAELV